MSSKNKIGTVKDSKIIFVRRYPFYCSVQNQGTGRGSKLIHSYSFQVTVSAVAPMNKDTGMTVNLVLLDHIAKNIFNVSRVSDLNISQFLEAKLKLLEKALKIKKIKLTSVQFDECRGLSLVFKGRQKFSVHHDYATDEKGDLFKISSRFNVKNELVELDIKNLKLDLHERIIF